MEKKHIVKAFNEHLLELYRDLKIIFPKNNDVRAGKNMVETLGKFNHKKMIHIWYMYITTIYGDKIKAGDDNFFINHNFQEECEINGTENQQENMEWMESLKKLWVELNGENKLKTIKYFQNLTKMSELYNN